MRRSVALALAGVAAIAAAPAEAATTFGSSLRQRADLYIRCAGVCTAVQSARPGGAGLTIPADGVLTRWRVRAATLGSVRFRVVRPEADGGYSAVTAAEWVRLDRAHAPGEDVLYTFPVRIAVRAGDAIALDRDPKAGALFHSYREDTTYGVAEFVPALADDGMARMPSTVRSGRELLLNADVEADGDGDGFGDESQDNCPTVPNDQTDRPCSTAEPQSTTPTGPTSETVGTPPRTRGSDGPPVAGERPLARGKRRHRARRPPRARPPRASDPERRHVRRRSPRAAPRRPARRDAGRHDAAPRSRPTPVARRRPSARHERGEPRRRAPRPAPRRVDGHRRRVARPGPPRTQDPRGRAHRRRASRPAPRVAPPPGWRRHE